MAVESVYFPSFKEKLPSMAGKTVVITGTTSGTGSVAAATVAELGAKVVMLNRPSSRSEAALADLTARFPDAEIHQVDCDLQSFSTVEAAAENVRELCPEGVHVECNNAGVMALPDRATEDGFDVQMQTNHLSHFLLTRELFDLLERAAEATGEARIVNHTSVARMVPKKKLIAKYMEKRGGELGGDGSALANLVFMGPRWLRYNQSKLANAAFTAALHHKLQKKGSKVKALMGHPGLANTQLQQTTVKEGGMGRKFTDMFMKTGQSPEDGAMGILSCICLPDAESGQFWGCGLGKFASKGPAKPYPLESFYDNEQTRELLWQKSTEAIGKEFSI